MPETKRSDGVPCRMTEYDDDADLEISESGVIENHDELVNNGQTADVVRVVTRDSAERHGLYVVRPGDKLWTEDMEGCEVGDRWLVDDLTD